MTTKPNTSAGKWRSRRMTPLGMALRMSRGYRRVRKATERIRSFTTALVVDDDPASREMIAELLQRRGFAVISAANGEEALRCAEHTNHIIDVVITDVVMPDMGGPELALRLGEFLPGAKVVFVSGYADQSSSRGVLEGARFLAKPFRPSALVETVEAFVGEPKKAP